MNETRVGLSRTLRVCSVMLDAVQRHRIRAAALVGIGTCLGRVLADLLAVPIAQTAQTGVQMSSYLLLLSLLCWPLTSYALAFRLALAAAIGLVSSGVINALVRWPDIERPWPYFIPVVVISGYAVLCAVAFAFLSALIYVRKRCWPLYPPGHCGRCGYDLYGLEIARCPECGTPFGSKKTIEEGMRQEEPSPRDKTVS